jgi:hypothetical protein
MAASTDARRNDESEFNCCSQSIMAGEEGTLDAIHSDRLGRSRTISTAANKLKAQQIVDGVLDEFRKRVNSDRAIRPQTAATEWTSCLLANF